MRDTEIADLLNSDLGLCLGFCYDDTISSSCVYESIQQIHLRRNDFKTLSELSFVMAHEARHIWQRQRLHYTTLAQLRVSGEESLLSYRAHPLEYDADRYAEGFLNRYFWLDTDEIINPFGDNFVNEMRDIHNTINNIYSGMSYPTFPHVTIFDPFGEEVLQKLS